MGQPGVFVWGIAWGHMAIICRYWPLTKTSSFGYITTDGKAYLFTGWDDMWRGTWLVVTRNFVWQQSSCVLLPHTSTHISVGSIRYKTNGWCFISVHQFLVISSTTKNLECGKFIQMSVSEKKEEYWLK